MGGERVSAYDFERTTPEDWAKFAGFFAVGIVIHAFPYFATVFSLWTLKEEPPKPKDEPTLVVVPPPLEEADIVEVDTLPDEGAGSAAKEDDGSMGTDSAEVNKRYAVKGPSDNADPHIARQAALRDAAEFGMIGLLNSGAGGDPDAPTAPWGREDSLGTDALSARGNMWGDSIGDAYGAGGLGLSGIGEGGGGRGEGIGLGSIGTLGHGAGTGTGQGFGSGNGRLGGAHRSKPPSVRMGAISVNGRLPPEVIQRIVRQNFGRFRLCYESGLKSNPNLAGRVSVAFTIAKDGSVKDVSGSGDLGDAGVVSCITKAFYGLSFPEPEGGDVKVNYPIAFAPGDGGSSSSSSTSSGSSSSTTKSLADATSSDVRRALESAGLSGVSSRSNGGATIFSGEKGGSTFTITFVPAGASADALTKEERARLDENASVRQSGGALLAVESTDKSAARSLLSSLRF